MIRKNDPDDRVFTHYVVRCQRVYTNRTIEKLRVDYPHLEIVLDIEYQPNAINLYNRFKERYTRRGQNPKFTINRNHVSLERHDERLLIEILNEINDEKMQVELD